MTGTEVGMLATALISIVGAVTSNLRDWHRATALKRSRLEERIQYERDCEIRCLGHGNIEAAEKRRLRREELESMARPMVQVGPKTRESVAAVVAMVYGGIFLSAGWLAWALDTIDAHRGGLTLILGLVVGTWASYRLLRKRGELR